MSHLPKYYSRIKKHPDFKVAKANWLQYEIAYVHKDADCIKTDYFPIVSNGSGAHWVINSMFSVTLFSVMPELHLPYSKVGSIMTILEHHGW